MNNQLIKKILDAPDLKKAVLSTSGDPTSRDFEDSRMAVEAKQTIELMKLIEKNSNTQDKLTKVIIFLTILNLVAIFIQLFLNYKNF